MKIPMLIELVRLLNKLIGRDEPHIPVPDIDEIRENEIKRMVRIEREMAELEKLQAERAARADRNGQIPPAS